MSTEHHITRRWFLPFPGYYQGECACGETVAARTAGEIGEAYDRHVRETAPHDVALTWETSPEHRGLQGVLLSDRGEQGTLW